MAFNYKENVLSDVENMEEKSGSSSHECLSDIENKELNSMDMDEKKLAKLKDTNDPLYEVSLRVAEEADNICQEMIVDETIHDPLHEITIKAMEEVENNRSALNLNLSKLTSDELNQCYFLPQKLFVSILMQFI